MTASSTKLIISVERTECANLKKLVKVAPSIVRIPKDIIWEKVTTRPHPSLVISEKLDSKESIYTATVKFFTCQKLDSGKKYAYRLRALDGHSFLVGTNKRPFPVFSIQINYPDKPSENQWNEVTITWSTPYAVPQMVP